MKNLTKTKKRKDSISRIVIFLFSLIGVFSLLAMFGAIIKESIPAYKKYGFIEMYTGASFTEKGNFGVWGALLLTLITSGIAVFIATPLSLRLAIFMKYKMKGKEKPLKMFINISSGVPSVIFGIFAIKSLTKLAGLFGSNNPNTLLIAILMLTIMIFPTLVSLIYNQLNLVDKNKINASIALGNSKTSTIYKIVKRDIRSQLFVAIIVALGRAIGETMALSMILTSPSSIGTFKGGLKNFLEGPFATLGVEISRQMFTDGSNPETRSALFAAGLAIFVIIMILISIITSISTKKKIIIRKPFEYNKILKTEYPSETIKYIILLLYLLFSPIRIILFGFQVLSVKWRKLKKYLVWLLLFPINKIFNIKKFNKETESHFYSRYRASKRSKVMDIIRNAIEIISTFIVIGFIGWIIISVMAYGLPEWRVQDWKFQYQNNSGNIVGGDIMNPLIWTITLILLSIVISTPFSIATAIYLSEYSRNKKSGKVIRFFLDSLGGTPSILFGIFGAIFFLNTMKLWSVSGGTSLIAGALTISLVILPTFTRSIEQTLIKIPDSMRYASYALGASKYETIKKIIMPQSIEGIATGIVLSSGRILAETAPVFLTLGMFAGTSIGLYEPGQTLTTNILFNQVFASGNAEVLLEKSYKLASVAILLITFISFMAEIVSYKSKIKKERYVKNKQNSIPNKES